MKFSVIFAFYLKCLVFVNCITFESKENDSKRVPKELRFPNADSSNLHFNKDYKSSIKFDDNKQFFTNHRRPQQQYAPLRQQEEVFNNYQQPPDTKNQFPLSNDNNQYFESSPGPVAFNNNQQNYNQQYTKQLQQYYNQQQQYYPQFNQQNFNDINQQYYGGGGTNPYPYPQNNELNPFQSILANLRDTRLGSVTGQFGKALENISKHDDLHCVPKIVCMMSKNPNQQSPISYVNRNLLKMVLTAIPTTSPWLTFSRAALLGFGVGDQSCNSAYPKCPKDEEEILYYLNNHRGGFFRFFNGENSQ